MYRYFKAVIIVIFTLNVFLPAEAAQTVTTSWGGNAEKVYDTGFMQMLMKHSGGGVSLFNMELIENDAPGSGQSEKGQFTDTIWGKIRALKILNLDDTCANSARIIVFPHYKSGKFPLKFTVNGNESALPNWDTTKNREWYPWNQFPAEWLKKGKNVIELFCPEAKTEEDGWEPYPVRCAGETPRLCGTPLETQHPFPRVSRMGCTFNPRQD